MGKQSGGSGNYRPNLSVLIQRMIRVFYINVIYNLEMLTI